MKSHPHALMWPVSLSDVTAWARNLVRDRKGDDRFWTQHARYLLIVIMADAERRNGNFLTPLELTAFLQQPRDALRPQLLALRINNDPSDDRWAVHFSRYTTECQDNIIATAQYALRAVTP